MATITCYDGVRCIGGNKILLEDAGTKIWLDFGLDFGRMGRFYEEFLQPKSCLGLYEPIQMDLLPPMRGLYRSDLDCGLADPWSGVNALDMGEVSGILFSHAHMDHIGSLGYVRDDIPIYCSALTLAIAKASQDSGAGGFSSNYCYTTAYEESESGELAAVHHTKAPSIARPYYLVGEQPSTPMQDFWKSTPGSLTARGRQHFAHDIQVADTCGGLRILRFPVDHSVLGASAWAVETANGWVVYTGDLRCHGRQAGLTWKFAKEAAALNPIALVIEGTRIEVESTVTEDDIQGRALEEARKAAGLVVADFGPRNIERLESFLQIAKTIGRKLLLTMKDAYLLQAMRCADAGVPSLTDADILIYDKYETSGTNWKKLLRERFQDRIVRPHDVAKRQGEFICCFSFFDVNELAVLKPVPGSVWIYSTCEPFNEEMEFDFKRLLEWMNRFQMVFPSGKNTDEGNPFHVSGHACQSDLIKLIEIIRPGCVIPIHTEKPQLYDKLLEGRVKVIQPERGAAIHV